MAYAPDEIFLMLGLAGGAFVVTHSLADRRSRVIFVMVVVVASYRQNVHAYPSGGGDYEVATVNLGPKAGLTVASALLVDYVLTVAVSVSSGVQNAATAIPSLRGHEVQVAIGLVIFLTAMNLRGVRESGKAFAVPVYAFIARHHRDGGRRRRPGGDRAAWARPRAPSSSSSPSPATRPWPASPRPSCCCAPSPPAVRP